MPLRSQQSDVVNRFLSEVDEVEGPVMTRFAQTLRGVLDDRRGLHICVQNKVSSSSGQAYSKDETTSIRSDMFTGQALSMFT